MNHSHILEFDIILRQLADKALSDAAKARCLALEPSLREAELRRWMDETTQTKRMLEQIGTPPLPAMSELSKILELIQIEALLMPEQLTQVLSFLVSCRRMKGYLKMAETTGCSIAWYGGSIGELQELEQKIEQCILNGSVVDRASARLEGIRRQMVVTADQMKEKLNGLLRKNKAWFSENLISVKNGRYTLPVKREHRSHVPGTVIELSNRGGTCFIEPVSVEKLQSKLESLLVEEDIEVRRILYTLTAGISDNLPAIRLNVETLETLDFLFAKGKLSISMHASPVELNTDRNISIQNARHPLLDPKLAVPLNFEAGCEKRGVVITGPNTGGKTVALKTVGLLSLMAQSGLHVPADQGSNFCMHNLILSDIGDGQSITENLSTFSSHMKNVIAILKQIDRESLVLLDELGSGTDPAEGMGIAVAVLDALREKGCIFVVTTHYPEIKEYAANTPGLVNARMAFDKDSLLPLYRLELGVAGESCALYIAERLGMPMEILARARTAAYGSGGAGNRQSVFTRAADAEEAASAPRIVRQQELKPAIKTHGTAFTIGDSVYVYPQKEIGIIYAPANAKGEVGVQIKGEKQLLNHKRVKLHVPASELYPENYDFSILFDSVANRKARRILERRHEEGTVVIIKEGDQET